VGYFAALAERPRRRMRSNDRPLEHERIAHALSDVGNVDEHPSDSLGTTPANSAQTVVFSFTPPASAHSFSFSQRHITHASR